MSIILKRIPLRLSHALASERKSSSVSRSELGVNPVIAAATVVAMFIIRSLLMFFVALCMVMVWFILCSRKGRQRPLPTYSLIIALCWRDRARQ